MRLRRSQEAGASSRPPSILRRAIRADGETGSIAVGKNADLLVLDDDMNIKLVVVKGAIKVNNL